MPTPPPPKKMKMGLIQQIDDTTDFFYNFLPQNSVLKNLEEKNKVHN